MKICFLALLYIKTEKKQTLMEIFVNFDHFNKNQQDALEKTTKFVNIIHPNEEKIEINQI